jgi:threonyl-tRNA synthetase
MITNYTLSNFRKLPEITKEELVKLQFSDGDVLNEVEDIRVRRTNIDKAIAMANSDKYKTFIILKAGNALYKIEAKVLSIRDNLVSTKEGIKIPINFIFSVDFL